MDDIDLCRTTYARPPLLPLLPSSALAALAASMHACSVLCVRLRR